MSDVYSGTLGTFFDRDKLVYKLTEYNIESEDNLNYEFMEDRTKLMIITGRNDIEKDLIPWSHPLVFKDTSNEDVIAIDLRPYMKSNLKDILSIREKLDDKYNGTILLYRMVMTRLILEKDLHWLNPIKGSLTEMFASVVSTIVSIILYDHTITETVKIVAKLHFISLLSDDEELSIEKAIQMLPREDVHELTKGSMVNLYKSIIIARDNEEVVFPSTTIGSLVTNIKAVSDAERTKGITVDILLQSISRGFFSIDAKELSFAIIEDVPSFIAVITMVISEGINSRSSFRKIVNNNKRKHNASEVSKAVISMYKKEILD